MADTPEQARVRAALRERGERVAPRVDPATGEASSGNGSARKTRAGTASERRGAVKGAIEGSEAGPAGAAVGAATGARKARKSRSSSSSRSSSRSRRSGPGIAKLKGPATGALFAEYFAAALIIVFGLFTEMPDKGYLPTMSKVMIRLTALTAVFFVLFLMQGSTRGAQLAIWFGLLVDLGVIFSAARGQTFSTMADIVSGKGTPAGTQTASASTTDTGPSAQNMFGAPPTPAGTQLPDEATTA